MLLDGVNRPGSLTLLSGPAGFGKTTLLSEFVTQTGRPVAWLSLDEGDNDPIRFWTYLVMACQSAAPGLGEAALGLLSTPQPLVEEAVPTILINDLSGLGRDLVLVLDDYHTIQNPSIQAAFSFLIENLPGNMHLVLSTRADPPWPLARLRVRNRLAEIRAQDLRFTTEEADLFLSRATGMNLPAEALAALEKRTEGWIAGLQLAALSLKGRSDIAGFIKAFTGSHMYVAEYLVEEVLQSQPENIHRFLLQTSILERLNAGLCEALLVGKVEDLKVEQFTSKVQPSDLRTCQEVLEYLTRSNLFIIPLDEEGQWFRYHQLFAGLLQARLQQEQPPVVIAELHRRAAAWHEQTGMIPEAIEHCLAAKDESRAVQLIEKTALPVILQGYVRTVDSWLQSIPPENVEKSPRINMAFAWLHLLRGTFDQATPYLERLKTIFSVPRASHEDPSLLGEWLAIQSKLLNLQARPAESRDLANQALQILPEAEVHVRSMALVNLATAYEMMLDYDDAAEVFQRITREAQGTGNYVLETLGTSGRGQMALQQGRLHLGFEIASEGIDRLEASGKSTPFSATLYGELGQIYYHWHQLDQARRYFQHSIQKSGQSGYSDPEIYHKIMLSRMFQMEGNWAASAQEMQEASDLARKIPPAMIREEVISQQVRVDLATGRRGAAQEILKREGFSFDEGFGYPELPPDAIVPRSLGLVYNSALRVLLFQARAGAEPATILSGIDLAGKVIAGEIQCQHIPSALETLLLRSQLYAALGDEQNSLADALKALEVAEPEGFVSIFIEEGEAVRLMIANCRMWIGKTGQEKTRNYIDLLLEAFPTRDISTGEKQLAINPPSAGQNLIEPLTKREIEVLQLIAEGDSNRTIAEELVITVSAVKKHTANIYGKLNVNSRTQAVSRARQIGLLPADA